MKEVFQDRIRQKREKMKLTQKEFAEKAGISSSSYNAYEQGLKTPPLTNAMKIAKAMGVSLDWLCGFEAENELTTYADVVRALVAVDNSLGIELHQDRETDFCSFSACLYRMPTFNGDEYTAEGLNCFDGDASTAFMWFLSNWEQMRPLIKSGTISIDILRPWFKEQYEKLNILLPKFRTEPKEGGAHDAQQADTQR